MKKSSKSRLTPKQMDEFRGDTLFDRIARAVCRAGCLPAKELFEAWEVARRIRRKYRGGRVMDLACGHGLLGHIMLILDNSSPEAICVDSRLPANFGRLSRCLLDAWPRLRGRIHFKEIPLETVPLMREDIVVSVHACGALTDMVMNAAIGVRAKVAVLPCCHDIARSDTGGLKGWMDGPLAVDATRAARLRSVGYTVLTHMIPAEITPKNRLLMGHPDMVFH